MSPARRSRTSRGKRPYLCLRCFVELVQFLGPQARRTGYRQFPRLRKGKCPTCGGTRALDPRILDGNLTEE